MPLFIMLQGAPGSGKSTWVRDHHLEDFTISLDTVRALFHAPALDLDNALTNVAPRSVHRRVIDTARAALEARLRQGSLVVLDTTAATPKAQRGWVSLAKQYGYTVAVHNLQADLTVDELLKRNEQRGRGHMDASIVERFYHQVEHCPRLKGTVPFDEDMLLQEHAPLDVSPYRRVVMIGDVHSHSDELRRVFDRFGYPEHTPDTCYVFVGDLFDRGDDPAGVLSLISGAGGTFHPNVQVIEGNHEHNLRVILAGHDQYRDTQRTLAQLKAAGVTTTVIRRVLAQLRPLVLFDACGTTWFCSHGGIRRDLVSEHLTSTGSWRQPRSLPDSVLIYGQSERQDTYGRRSTYTPVGTKLARTSADAGHEVVMVHGHRNNVRGADPLPIDAAPGVLCLEQGIGDGGGIGVCALDLDTGAVTTNIFTTS